MKVRNQIMTHVEVSDQEVDGVEWKCKKRLKTYIIGPASGSVPPNALRSTALPASAEAA
jgi:hypothetical protein